MGTDTSVGFLPRTEEEKRMSEEICKNERLQDVKFWYTVNFWASTILVCVINALLGIGIAHCVQGELPFVLIVPFAIFVIVLTVFNAIGFRAFMDLEYNLSV